MGLQGTGDACEALNAACLYVADQGTRRVLELRGAGVPANGVTLTPPVGPVPTDFGIEPVGGTMIEAPALATAFKASGASLACLCSSDKVYEKDAVAAAQALKAAGAKHIYLAGRPRDQQAALTLAGVQSFIYEGCDALAVLQGAHQLLTT